MVQDDLRIRLCRARDRLCDVLDEELSVAAVAREARLSAPQFIRLYKALFGWTPLQHRNRARLARARVLLAESDLPVTAVCLDVGFTSLGSFSSLFARETGLSPSAWRRRPRPPEPRIPGCFGLMGGPDDAARRGAAQFSRSGPRSPRAPWPPTPGEDPCASG